MTRATRSATGNSKPRVIPVIDTAPTITRKAPTKKKVATKTEATGAKPTGITKKKKAPKKDSTVAKVSMPFTSLVPPSPGPGTGCPKPTAFNTIGLGC
jgi:hypothetical protein